MGSTHKRGPGRRGRKSAVIVPEISDADVKDLSSDFAWWRGGMLSKYIFQKGMLPQMMIKRAARQGKFQSWLYFEGGKWVGKIIGQTESFSVIFSFYKKDKDLKNVIPSKCCRIVSICIHIRQL